MERILVIGFGNPYRGDDGLGLHAAEQFEGINHDPAVTVLAQQELHPELAEVLSHADFVIFLDATAQGVPGTVSVCKLTAKCEVNGLFSHELTPETLLAAAKVLYGRCPEGMLVSVAGENFGISSHLSPEVSAALPRVLARIEELIDSLQGRELVLTRAARAGNSA
jgi:hydrogenase maturation protease